MSEKNEHAHLDGVKGVIGEVDVLPFHRWSRHRRNRSCTHSIETVRELPSLASHRNRESHRASSVGKHAEKSILAEHARPTGDSSLVGHPSHIWCWSSSSLSRSSSKKQRNTQWQQEVSDRAAHGDLSAAMQAGSGKDRYFRAQLHSQSLLLVEKDFGESNQISQAASPASETY